MSLTAFKRTAMAAALAVAATVSSLAGQAQAFSFGDGDLVLAIYGNNTEAVKNLGNYATLLTNPSQVIDVSAELAAAQVGSNPIKYTIFGFDSLTGNGQVFAASSFAQAAITGVKDFNNQFTNVIGYTALPFSGTTIAKSNGSSFSSNLNTSGAGSFDGSWPVAMQGTLDNLVNLFMGDSVDNTFSQVGRALLASNGTLTIGNPGPSAVPLPAGVVLFGTGLIGLVGIARRSFNRMTA